MPTFENLESLASVRAKINDGISNAQTALNRLDTVETTVTSHGVRITALEGGGGGGGGATNLTWDAATSTVASDAGTDATLTLVDGSNPGLMSVADKTKLNAISGTNTGDQTSIVGITGTKAQFDTAVTDGNIMYVGDAPTAHTHLLAAGATDVTITAANLNALDDGVNTTLHFHDADRARANHTGSQASTTISDFTEAAQDAVGAMVDASLTYVDGTPLLQRAALTGHITASAGSNATTLGSFTKAQLDTAVSDGNVLYVGDAPTAHTHTLANITDVTMTVANLNSLDDGVNTTLHFHDADRARANHTGTQLASTVSDFSEAVDDRVAALVVAGTNMTITYNDGAGTLTLDAAGGGAGTNLSYTAATRIIASDTGTDATLPLVTTGDAGLAPASGGGTTNFLRADGTWAAPAGGGSAGEGPDSFVYFNDFQATTTDQVAQVYTSSGGVAIVAWPFAGNPQGSGFARLNLSSSGSRAGWASTNIATGFYLRQGATVFKIRASLMVLSNGTNDYDINFGFVNDATASPTYGIFFRYRYNVNGGRWEAVTVAGGSPTVVDTGVTAVIDTMTIFAIEIDASGSCVFKINGATVATISTTVPAAGINLGLAAMTRKTVGAGSIFPALLDYVHVTQAFTGRG